MIKNSLKIFNDSINDFPETATKSINTLEIARLGLF